MESLALSFEAHGVLTVFLGVLVEQLGAPLPSLPFLLLAGVRAHQDGVFAVQAFVAALAAATLANGLWFAAGRRHGRRVLSTLCSISISPDTCVRQNELSFARRGVATLLVAKFVPGLSILAPPLAGALGMDARRFVLFNLAGSAAWAASGIGAGWLFHQQIGRLLAWLGRLGGVALVLAGVALAGYLAWRWWRRRQADRAARGVQRIEPGELAARMAQGQAIVVVDVRAALPGMPISRIPGALAIDLGAVPTAPLHAVPAAAEVVTYCDCPHDASAAKAAQLLAARGFQVRVLHGGVGAWTLAGQPLDSH